MEERIRTNERMRAMLAREEIRSRLDCTPLDPKLQALINSGLVEIKGCWFLRRLIRRGFDFDGDLGQFTDHTDLEWSENGIHPDLVAHKHMDPDDLFLQGYAYAMQLARLLEGKGSFRIYLSFDVTDGLYSCKAGFFRVRSDEPPMLDDPEASKLNALLTLDTSERM